MIDNVRSAMSRVEAIRSTIGRTGGGTDVTLGSHGVSGTRSARSTASFSQLLSQATERRTLGDFIGHTSPLGHTSWGGPQTPLVGTDSGAPRGLEGFQNGLIPLERLSPIPGNEFMWSPAAESFKRMYADAARDGVNLIVIDAYRPLADQHRLADELGLYKEGGWAAVPGTSQHGWGRAVDLTLDDAALAWMREHASKYGFVETVPREPWHWEYHGV